MRKDRTLGWSRSRAASAAMEARAVRRSAAFHFSPVPVGLTCPSHLLQHSQPGSNRIPCRSARSKNSSGSMWPSRRNVFRPASSAALIRSSAAVVSQRSSSSADQPAPRIRRGRPLIVYRRAPAELRDAFTSRMPKGWRTESERLPATVAVRWSPYRFCGPMPAGHHRAGRCRRSCRWRSGAKTSVRVSRARRVTSSRSTIPVPLMAAVTVAVAASRESLRTRAFTVSSAGPDPGDGTSRPVTTWASCSETGPRRRTRTSRTMPMLASGGGCSQSSQPSVRCLRGSLGWIRKATVLVPARTRSVMSSSWRVYTPATSAAEATCRPLTYTSAAEITPLKSSEVRSEVSGSVKSLRYHHGSAKSRRGMRCWSVE